MGPTTAIAAGDRTIYPNSLKPDNHYLTIRYTDAENKISIASITLEK